MSYLSDMGWPSVYNGFVFGIHDDLQVIHRLNPFTTAQQIIPQPHLPIEDIDSVLSKRFNGRPFTYTASGRHAIREALRILKLDADDCVTILTSTGNHYISACVTSEIEVVCRWSRKIESTTKVLFVNHEFGLPYPKLDELTSLGFPIIEDCCYAFNSATANNRIGQVGDFVLYSFAKYFPIQFGGILVGNNGQVLDNELLDKDTTNYLRECLGQLYPETTAIATRRIANHDELARRFAPLGLLPRFDFSNEGVPGVFMFRAPANWPLPALKDYLWKCGIHCSVFYGEQSFFIPVHQGLDTSAIAYFETCVNKFAQEMNTHK